MEPMQIVMLAGLFWCCVWAGVGAYVAGQKGRSEGEGMVFGGLLGPIGVIVVAILPTVAKGAKAEKSGPAPVYQFKPRKILGEIREDRSLRKID